MRGCQGHYLELPLNLSAILCVLDGICFYPLFCAAIPTLYKAGPMSTHYPLLMVGLHWVILWCVCVNLTLHDILLWIFIDIVCSACFCGVGAAVSHRPPWWDVCAGRPDLLNLRISIANIQTSHCFLRLPHASAILFSY